MTQIRTLSDFAIRYSANTSLANSNTYWRGDSTWATIPRTIPLLSNSGNTISISLSTGNLLILANSGSTYTIPTY